MQLIFRLFLILIITLFAGVSLDAQIRDLQSGRSSDPEDPNYDPTKQNEEFDGFDSIQMGKDPSLPDTTIFDHFTLLDIHTLHPYIDTTLDNAISYADPARSTTDLRANLGNVASSNYALLYSPSTNTGFNSGFRQYDAYNYTIENFKYFKTNRAISDLFFTSIDNQQNLAVKADFTRNFADGIQLSVNYQRYSNEGFYSQQRARTTNLGTGFWYQSEKDKYNLFITYISNVNTEEQNGGISDMTLFGTEFADFRTSIPTFLTNANTRHQLRTVRASNYYKLGSTKDNKWNLQLQYDLGLEWNYWNYDDDITNTLNDSTIYQSYIVDLRGARSYIRDNNLTQSFYIHGIGPNGISGKVGLQYDRHHIEQADRDSTINDLSLNFTANIPVFNSLLLNSLGSFGLGANAGSFDLNGRLQIDVQDWASLLGGASLYRRSIELTEDNFYINEEKIYDTDFSKPFGSTVYGILSIPKLHTDIKLQQILENNPIMWGQDALPYQFDGLFSVTQLSANLNVSVFGFHLDNHVQYQILSDDIISLPKFASTHKFYWDGHLFSRKMNLRIGAQTRIVPSYTPQAFIPMVGRFHAGSSALDYYPDTDFFLSIKVQTLRVFFQLENFSDIWSDDTTIDYQVENYPQFDMKLRYGIRWVLFD